MNTFNPMILKPSNTLVKEAKIDTYVDTIPERDCIYDLLEFDVDVHSAEVDHICEYYKLVLESGNKPDHIIQEGVIGSIVDFIKSIITGIIDFLKGIFGGNSSASKDKVEKQKESITKYEEKVKTEIKKPSNDPDKGFRTGLSISYIENIPDASGLNFSKLQSVTTDLLQEHFDKIKSDSSYKISKEDLEKLKSESDESNKLLLQMLKLPEDIKIEEILSTVAGDISLNSDENMKILDKSFETIRLTSEFFSNVSDKYKDMERALTGTRAKFEQQLKSIEGKVDDTTFNDISNATRIVLAAMKSNYTFIGRIANKAERQINKCTSSPKRRIDTSLDVQETYMPKYTGYTPGYFAFGEASMHGEELNAETMFINGMDDFNNTTWIDLSLEEAVYDFRHEMLDIKKKAYINECLIRSSDSPSYDRLIELNEAVGDKIKKAIETMIEKIKQIIAKFNEKLMNNFRSDKAYVEKYAKIIKNQQPKDEDAVIDGEIFAGMHRVVQVGVPTLNYQSMSSDMENENVLFSKVFVPNMNKNIGPIVSSDVGDFDPDGQVSITDWCKQYFGYKDPNNNERTVSMRDSSKVNMTDIYDFLYNVSKITDSVKKDIKSIEENANKALGQIPKEDTNKATDTQPELNSDSKNESAYSYIYKTYITEADFKDKNAEKTGTDTTSSTNEPKKPATNIQGDQYKDNDEAKKDVSTGEDSDVISSGIRVYISVANSVLKAKITAVEYIRNEVKAIVRHHVENFINKETQTKRTQKSNNK